jgi:hypothetical protein
MLNADPGPDSGGHNALQIYSRKSKGFSCFEVLDVLF